MSPFQINTSTQSARPQTHLDGARSHPSRRAVLAGVSGVFAASATGGCDLLSTDPEAEDTSDSQGPNGDEAPRLAERVEQGDLPPVADRLPNKPMVIEPVDRIGQYGGRWRGAVSGPSENAYIYCLAGYENLVKWSVDWIGTPGTDEIEPNVAESFDVSEDGTRYTFTLREGMRWSDGEPFTADDVVFAVNDILLNERITPITPNLLLTRGGEPASIEKLDDYSFEIVFPEPNSMFLRVLATPDGHELTSFPRHHVEKFHPDYNDDVEELVESEGAADVEELIGMKGGSWSWGENPDLPTLFAWMLVQPFAEGSSVRLERNPYYFKVDSEGSQLPYIDEVVLDIIEDTEVLQLRAANGEIDLEAGPNTRFTSLANKPVLARQREDGDFRFIDVKDERSNTMVIHLNRNHKNPALREVFANKDVRIGLSHAIDRDELIDVTMQRQGEPYQMAPNPDSPFYDEEFATQYTEFDVDLANEYLDRAGYTERDEEGIRLGPDGEPISFQIAIADDFRPEWVEMLNLISESWADAGVDMSIDNLERSLFTVRRENNDIDASVWTGDGGLDIALDPAYYAPATQGSLYASLWGQWYETRGAEGEEPSDAAKRQLDLLDQVKATTDVDEQNRLIEQLLEIAREEFYVIGTARETEKYFLVSNDFHNVPDPMLQGWRYPTPGPTETSQYFIASS